jgi:hypothetical protein
MPRNASALEAGLLAVASSPPDGPAECAAAWADAVASFATGIVPPSSTVAAAASALEGSLAAAFQTTNAAPLMEVAFLAFATAVGGGMAGYTPTPPAAPVGFATEFAAPFPADHGEAASNIASLIDTWMRTGIATLAVPPNTVLPWS